MSTAAANAVMMQRLLGTGYELHPLGSRKDDDPFGHMKASLDLYGGGGILRLSVKSRRNATMLCTIDPMKTVSG